MKKLALALRARSLRGRRPAHRRDACAVRRPVRAPRDAAGLGGLRLAEPAVQRASSASRGSSSAPRSGAYPAHRCAPPVRRPSTSTSTSTTASARRRARESVARSRRRRRASSRSRSSRPGCATPVIVLNELSGPGLVTPWSDNNAQYRANVLAFVQDLAALGAHPVLLLPSNAVHRRRRAHVVAAGGRSRPSSCARSYVAATVDLEAGACARQPQPPQHVPARGRGLHLDRHPARTGSG